MEVTRPFTFSYFPEIHIKKKKKGGNKETGKKIQRKISKVKTPSSLSWASEMHLRNNFLDLPSQRLSILRFWLYEQSSAAPKAPVRYNSKYNSNNIDSYGAGYFVSPGGGGGLEDFACFTMIKLCNILMIYFPPPPLIGSQFSKAPPFKLYCSPPRDLSSPWKLCDPPNSSTFPSPPDDKLWLVTNVEMNLLSGYTRHYHPKLMLSVAIIQILVFHDQRELLGWTIEALMKIVNVEHTWPLLRSS